MSLPIRYTFSLISPFSYLGAETFFDMAKKSGATLTYRTIAIGNLFAETGGLPPAKRHPSRQAYRMMDLARWKERRGKTKMNLKPAFFPADDSLASACVNAAIAEGTDPQGLILGLHNLVWEDEGNIADADAIHRVGAAAGYDMARLMDAAASTEISSLREIYTHEAIDEGVFGAPWYQVGNESFWGQDNLDHIADLLGVK